MNRRRGILAGSGRIGSGQTPYGGLIIPPGSGLQPTAAFRTLQNDWAFTGGSLPADWNAVTNTSFDFTDGAEAAVDLYAAQTTMTGTAAKLGLDTAAHAGYGSATYVGGCIATTTAPGATASYYLPNYFHLEVKMQMPSFSGGANASGVWPAIALYSSWAATNKAELDVIEQNMAQPFAINSTIHDNAPSTPWSKGQVYTMGANPSAGFNKFGIVKEPGQVTFGLNGVAILQWTAVQAVAAGNTWDLDGAQDVYITIQNSLTTTGVFGTPWSTGNNSQLTAGNVNVFVEEVLVWD